MKITVNTKTLFCDLETLTGNNEQYRKQQHTQILYWYCKGWTTESEGEDDKSLLEFFIKQRRFIMYFHNLAFDGAFIESILYRHGYTFIQDKREYKNYKQCFNVFKVNNRIYSIEVWGPNRSHYTFQCTKLMLSASIESLGVSTGITKKNDYMLKMGVENFMNYACTGWNNDKEFEVEYKSYCKRDVEIMMKAYYMLQDTLDKYELLKIVNKGSTLSGKSYENIKDMPLTSKLTVGALTKTMFFSMLEDKTHIRKNDLMVQYKHYKDYRGWLNGGLTQFNMKYKLIEFKDFYFDDISSAYPFAMTKPLPFGELLDNIPKDGFGYIEFLEIYINFGIIKEEWEHIPCLKSNGKGSRYYGRNNPVVAGIYKYTKREWDIISDMYDLDIRYIKSKYAKAHNFANTYINIIYPLKQNAKDNAEKLTFKIMLNSLYGKLIERADQHHQIFDNDTRLSELLKEETTWIGDYEYEIISRNISKTGAIANKLNHIKVQKIFNPNDLVLNPLIGAVITSNCRVQVLERIRKLPKDSFLYCDTDSVAYLNFDKSQELLDFGKNLGDWESEGHFSKGIIMGAKKYKFYKDDGEQFKSSFAGMHTACRNPCELFFESDIEHSDNYENKYQEIKINNAAFIKEYDGYGIILKRIDKTFYPSKGTN